MFTLTFFFKASLKNLPHYKVVSEEFTFMIIEEIPQNALRTWPTYFTLRKRGREGGKRERERERGRKDRREKGRKDRERGRKERERGRKERERESRFLRMHWINFSQFQWSPMYIMKILNYL